MSARFFNKIHFLALVCFLIILLVGPSASKSLAEQVTEVKIIPWYYQPHLNSLEKMEYIYRKIQNDQIQARKDAGKEICYGNLKITSNPPDAKAWISSYLPQGNTPFIKEQILCGKQRVTIRKTDYYEQARMVDINPNTLSTLHFDLKPIPYAKLFFETIPSDAKIRIIGPPYDYSPGIKLAPGEYTLEINHPNCGVKRVCVQLDDHQSRKLVVFLDASTGSLEINSNQPDSVVYLDGQEVGLTPMKINGLLSGPHKLQVWKSLYKPVTRIINIGINDAKKIDIDLKQVDYFVNSIGMEFVKIPAGKFMMGFRDNPDIFEKHDNDKNAYMYFMEGHPRHLVEISKPFYMQTTEVTMRQWDKVMEKQYIRKDDTPYGIHKLEDIAEFISKLNKFSNGKYRYRLPTEAEWEYACRAGTTGRFYTGEKITPEQVAYHAHITLINILGKHFDGATKSNKQYQVTVKRFSCNPFGLYGMHGNIAEVCDGFYDIFFNVYCSIVDPNNITKNIGAPAARGGSWCSLAMGCMSSSRMAATQDRIGGGAQIGFRLIAEKCDKD